MSQPKKETEKEKVIGKLDLNLSTKLDRWSGDFKIYLLYFLLLFE